MLKCKMLERLASLAGMDKEPNYSELMGLTAFTGIPADLCEVVAENVEIYNRYMHDGWRSDKAAVLTLAETEGLHLENIFKNCINSGVSADTMREVLSLCELGVDFKGKPLPSTYPELSDTIIAAFKEWLTSWWRLDSLRQLETSIRSLFPINGESQCGMQSVTSLRLKTQLMITRQMVSNNGSKWV